MNIHWRYILSRGEFNCEHTVGHKPCWTEDQTHGCCGCCKGPDFPGRMPKVGDIAVCGKGSIGVLIHDEKDEVVYPDDSVGLAWVGLHLTNAIGPVGAPWSSRNPCIISNVLNLHRPLVPDSILANLYDVAVAGWPLMKHRNRLTDHTRVEIKAIILATLELPTCTLTTT